MSKVIYNGKECEVISVETKWMNGGPTNTWLLINCDGYLFWVELSDCRGCSNV